MKKLLLTTILAFAATNVLADDVALVLGNERYDRFDRVLQGDDVGDGAVALTRAGVRVYSTLNGDFGAMRAQAIDFLDDRDGISSQIVVLSGRFATDGQRTWLLARDAANPGLFSVAGQGISVETLLGLMAATPGKSVLVLGVDEGSTRRLNPGLHEGIGDLDIPQGVTVVQGRPSTVADLLADTFASGDDIMEQVRRNRRLTLQGYAPATLSLISGDGPAPVVIDRAQDTRDWQMALRVDTANGYSAYLNRNPRGQYVQDARDKLEEIRSEPNRAARLREEALGLDRDDRRAVQRDLTVLDFDTRGIDGIFGPGSRRAITNWQQQNGFAQTSYLTGEQIARIDAQATRRSDELEAAAERQRRAEEARDRAYWDETGASGDEVGLRAYLSRYPDGLYSDPAEERLTEIEDAKRARAEARDRDAWDRARERNTIPAYRDYLSGNRNGTFRAAAEARIERLEAANNAEPARQAAEEAEAAMRLDPLLRRLIEARLAQQGLEPGPVDGTFDNRTRRAIRRYQRDRNIDRTGFLNQETVSLLLRNVRN